MKTMSDVFVHTLRDVYYAESALTNALPKLADAATNKDLKKAISDHLSETKDQIAILEGVFGSLGEDPSGEKCDAIEGLIKETEGVILEAKSGKARDIALIGCCQAVEHYEIARYGTLREWAKVLGHEQAHDLLSKILDQEKAANSKLTNLAVTETNSK